MNEQKGPRFDYSKISKADEHNLCATFLEACLRFYDDPANRERFEQWQKRREEQGKTAAKVLD